MTGCPLHSPEVRSHIIFYTFVLLRPGRKCQLGPQRMETSHDLAFRNIPPLCTSDEKGFQPWGWKCTLSSRVPLLPLLNATSRNRSRTPAVAHTLTHTSLCVGDAPWCGHTLFALGLSPQGRVQVLFPEWLSRSSPVLVPSCQLLLFVHPQKVLSRTSGRVNNFQVLTTTLPMPPRSSN